MPRRGMNIYKRKDGRWEGRIKKEDAEKGRRSYRSVYGKTYAEVKDQMDTVKMENPSEGEKKKGTLNEAVCIWLKERSPYWKKTTYAVYFHMTHKYILPRLGDASLVSLDEGQIEEFIVKIRQEKKLSNRYQRMVCGLIVRVMKYMKRRHRLKAEIPENPLSPEKSGSKNLPREKNLAMLEQYLTEHARMGEETCLGILTVFYTGLRIGEVCALTWNDIDLEESVIHIRRNLQRVKSSDGQEKNTMILLQTPKTETSCRVIPIPPVLLPLLQKQRQDSDCYFIKGKKKPWAEPRTLQYRFTRILKACGLEHFNFHMLRHAFATHCIAEGFDLKSLSEILGHSSAQVTLNFYIHSDMQRKRQLMGQFESSLYTDSCEKETQDKGAWNLHEHELGSIS